MTGIRVDMTVFPGKIKWGEAVSGIARLTQSVAINYRTNLGSDVISARGNALHETVRDGGMYDAMNAQHALNFAVIATSDWVRAEPTTVPAETLGSFSATNAGTASRRLAVDLRVTNALGESAVMPVRIQQ